ncbi:hypothetical protein V6347_12390 [Acinetobacter baumannii]|uniref:hypothetical protein n=1 Tax=Acinetobacter baumannii TaxID=470 RepID=UPI0021489D9F|nr:hypothetical protein [Acinetobacter baumannii]MCR0006089.1 hypothetical protein [Acinetobacter baumannii]MDC5138747.1 hypothetical protein [Acinetobacter baumannii]HAV3581469.1 hypothetical protein [Acinetobacter baumannii]
MSFASLFWAIAAMMQACMLSQFGQKKLQYSWLKSTTRRILYGITILFLLSSLFLNCSFEGSSVGVLLWFFAIITTAFFLQIIVFYSFRKYFIPIWLMAIVVAIIFSIVEWLP